MPPKPTLTIRRFGRAFAVVVLALGLGSATWLTASALPALTQVAEELPQTVSATLESSTTAVPTTGAFRYTAHIRLANPASYLQTRIRVRRPSGRLVFQRTQVDNSVAAGEQSASFGRELEGLDLVPGVYPVELEVRAVVGGSTETTEVATELLVYDPAEEPAGVVLLTRIMAQPLEDTEGRFVIDPAVATKARDDAAAVASIVLADSGTRVTVSIAPVLLGEWRRISSGYTMADGTKVAATDPTPVAYSATLELLQAAIATGRLELVAAGLADPDVEQLVAQGRGADIAAQYDEGLSTIHASLETSPSTGTVPAGACVPPSALAAFNALDIGYIALDAGCARAGEATPTSGSYTIANSSVRALLIDTAATLAASSADTTGALNLIATRQVVTPKQPVIVQIDLTEGGPDATATVLPTIRGLQRESWARPLLGRDARSLGKPGSVRLVAERTSTTAPKGYWAKVSLARRNAMALMSAMGVGSAASASAQTNSLLAEAVAWSQPDGTWAGADRGSSFANAALTSARAVFDKVALKLEPVTLSSARGEVPVNLQNGTKEVLNVTMRTSTSGGIDVIGRDVTKLVLPPQETFVQIPVDMHSSLSGKLTVELLAGDLVIAQRTVDIRASYLDRLVIIGGIVLALGVLLAFIVKRVRAAERAEHDSSGESPQSARYTEHATDTSNDSEDE